MGKQFAFRYGEEIFVDLFAGGGGASEGVRQALDRSPHVAVNHDPEAVALHAWNHPRTEHYRCDVFEAVPLEVTRGRPVGGLWLSPDCTHHSKARGGTPFRDPEVSTGRRALADVGVEWAKQVRPRVIFLENVEEWKDWGPLCAQTRRPIHDKRGTEFRRWVADLEAVGYVVEWRELRASDYGAPTSRKRLFLIARCDGQAIVWPDPTHGPGRAHPFRTAAECIDWTLPSRSIFERDRPLAENTMRRIARGIRRFVLEAAEPFVVDLGDQVIAPTMMKNMTNNVGGRVDEPLSCILTGNHHYLVAPTLIHSGNGERVGQAPRVYDIRQPLGTVMATGQKHALISAFLAKHYGGHEGPGADLRQPTPTVTTRGQLGVVGVHTAGDRRAEVHAFLTKYYGQGTGQSLRDPLDTVTTRDRFGLVMVHGEAYEIADITHRMLQPRELFNAMGFSSDYVIDAGPEGRTLTRTAQIRLCGNAVCPAMARELVRANLRGAPAERRAA